MADVDTRRNDALATYKRVCGVAERCDDSDKLTRRRLFTQRVKEHEELGEKLKRSQWNDHCSTDVAVVRHADFELI